jgi:hypothetical protein
MATLDIDEQKNSDVKLNYQSEQRAGKSKRGAE